MSDVHRRVLVAVGLVLLVILFGSTGYYWIGAGKWSIDRHIDSAWLWGWKGLVVTVVAGIGGGIALLAVFWRPPAKSSD